MKTPVGQLTLSLSPPLPAACAVVVSELVSALKKKREQRKFKLTPDENMGALERGCFQVRRDYGLQMRNNKVTPVYSNDHSIAKHPLRRRVRRHGADVDAGPVGLLPLGVRHALRRNGEP